MLGAGLVAGVAATGDGGLKPIPVLFSPPVPIVAGQAYALTVTGPPAPPMTDYFDLHANTGVDRCPDGALFFDRQVTGAFVRVPGEADLVSILIVTD